MNTDLNEMNAAQLLTTFKQTAMVTDYYLNQNNMTKEDVKSIQRRIAITLWAKFPKAAKAEGIYKVA